MEPIKLKIPGSGDYFTQEAVKVLRTNLQFCGQDIHVIAVTSCHENEGKTTVSLNVAKSFAELGKKVLLVDADMRKSVIAGRNTNVKRVQGLSEVLTGMKSVGECLFPTEYPGMRILFAGKYPPNPVELLSGRYFSALIAEARKAFDYIIVDTPPVGMVIDAAVVAPLCDGVVIVMNENNVTYTQAREAVDQLKRTGSKVLGVVMNNAKPQQKIYYRKK